MKTINWIILRSKDRGTDYGVGTFIKQLSEGLSHQMNIEVFVLEIGNDSLREFVIEKKADVTYFKFPASNYLKDVDTITRNSKFAKSIVRVVMSFLPEKRKNVVHLNFVFQYFIGNEFKKAIDCTVIFTQHLFILESDITAGSFDLENQTYSLSDYIIAVTNHGKNHLINQGINKEKITTIYNGIDEKLFLKSNGPNVRRKYGIGENDRLVLYSGRIDAIKGLKYLTQSFFLLLKRIPDCRLVIAGNGNFEELIRDSNVFSSNINFLGFIPFEDIIALYRTASIGVIPSLEEHCSYVALEMIHAGLPAVASNLGGLKEIFVHDENAFLAETIVDKTNRYGIAPKVEELENYMYNLLSDESLRTKFSINAKDRAISIFSAETMIENYLQIIKN